MACTLFTVFLSHAAFDFAAIVFDTKTQDEVDQIPAVNMKLDEKTIDYGEHHRHMSRHTNKAQYHWPLGRHVYISKEF